MKFTITIFTVHLMASHAFQPRYIVAQASSALLAIPVSTVSVCTAELCCCQEEMGGDDILASLLKRNLPYNVDEAPCLGACGGGAMVAIDFEDGSSALVSGMEEVLAELGLTEDTPLAEEVELTLESNSENNRTNTESPSFQQVTNKPIMGVSIEGPSVTKEVSSAVNEKFTITMARHTEKPVPELASKQPLNDVRERMRAEAENDKELANPWFNAASYLAGKATDKFFGKRK